MPLSSMSFDKFSVMYPPLEYHKEYFHSPKTTTATKPHNDRNMYKGQRSQQEEFPTATVRPLLNNEAVPDYYPKYPINIHESTLT